MGRGPESQCDRQSVSSHKLSPVIWKYCPPRASRPPAALPGRGFGSAVSIRENDDFNRDLPLSQPVDLPPVPYRKASF